MGAVAEAGLVGLASPHAWLRAALAALNLAYHDRVRIPSFAIQDSTSRPFPQLNPHRSYWKSLLEWLPQSETPTPVVEARRSKSKDE